MDQRPVLRSALSGEFFKRLTKGRFCVPQGCHIASHIAEVSQHIAEIVMDCPSCRFAPPDVSKQRLAIVRFGPPQSFRIPNKIADVRQYDSDVVIEIRPSRRRALTSVFEHCVAIGGLGPVQGRPVAGDIAEALQRAAEIELGHGPVTEANIRLDSVLSDIMGLSGRRMIEAMIAGVRDARKLAALVGRGVKATPKELYDALHGRLTDHHRFLLKLHLGQWDALQASIRVIDLEVDARVARMDTEARADKARFSDHVNQLASIPGVRKLSALAILSEIGTDMSRFETAGHLIAWAGMCPSQNESAGKRKGSRLRKGAPWLKTILVQCAWAAKRAKNSYYRAQFFRLQARHGPQKAICAVAASILTAIYHMLKNGTFHQDLGADYFDRRSPESKVKRLARQIAKLGYEVTLQLAAKAA